MKIKLDENLGERGAALFRAAGHEVASVPQQQLSGASDHDLIDACRREGRCLVTLDLDFSNPLVFKPAGYSGIAVLRLPQRAMDTEIWEACAALIKGLEAAPIQGREEATAAWISLGKAAQGKRQLIVYVPSAKPLTEEDKQRDPFQIFALGGDVFPRGDGDTYLSLCLQAKPDFQDKLYALFESGSPPSFETVDALDSGSTWPKLRTLLGVESPREILIALLSPTENQEAALTTDKSWLNE